MWTTEEGAKAVGTIAVWGGVAFLCSIFGSHNILSTTVAGWTIFAGVVSTAIIWN